MIIACERCQTRFKVPDEKLGAGPVRMRCSKCNHVFVASSAAETASAVPATTLPPGLAATQPPSFAAPSTSPRAQGAPPPSSTLEAPRTSTQPGAFGAPAPAGQAPVFGGPRAPSKTSLPPSQATEGFAPIPRAKTVPPDPFAGLAAATPAASVPVDPFAALVKPNGGSSSPGPSAPDPFAALSGAPKSAPAAPFAAIETRNVSAPDPFAAFETRNVNGPDPFAALAAPKPSTPAPQPSAPPTPSAPAGPDPFAPRAPSRPDPFAGLAAPAKPDPFAPRAPSRPDPFAGLTSSPPAMAPPQAAAAADDPFAALVEPSRLPSPTPSPAAPAPSSAPAGGFDPFAALNTNARAPTGPDPFAPAPPAPARPDPFRAPDASASPFGGDDPFGDPPPFAQNRSLTPMPPVPADDPFADDDAAESAPDGFGVDHDARAELFGIAKAPPPSLPPSPLESGSGLELSTTPPSAAAEPEPTPRRVMPAAPLVKALAATLQVAAIVGLTLLAVIVGRGGDPSALLRLDLAGAFHVAPAPENGLAIDGVTVSRRVSRHGVPLVVVSGVVHHRGEAAFDSLVVTARGDGLAPAGEARAIAWRSVDAFKVDDVKDDADLAAIAAAVPPSPKVAVGDRATFVVVARVDGTLGPLMVTASPPSP